MRKQLRMLALAGVIAAAGLTAACSPGDDAALVAQVQTIAKSVCSFVPTAETVIAIIAAGNSLAASASAIADAICKSVTTASAARGGQPPTVNGVVVKGHFIRR